MATGTGQISGGETNFFAQFIKPGIRMDAVEHRSYFEPDQVRRAALIGLVQIVEGLISLL